MSGAREHWSVRRRLAIVRVSLEEVRQALDLPPDVKVVSVMPPSMTDFAHNAVRVLLEGPTLPLTEAGQEPMVVERSEIR